jgi:uncharacterized protein DUF4345
MTAAAQRALLYAGGAVASAAGLHTAITGARSIPGHDGPADPVVESELRFYGTFYAAYGVAMLRAARRADDPGPNASVFASVLFAAGLARAGAWRAVGRPSRPQIALLALELGLAPLVARHRR